MGAPSANEIQPANKPVLLYKFWYTGKLPSVPTNPVCTIDVASPSCPTSATPPLAAMVNWQVRFCPTWPTIGGLRKRKPAAGENAFVCRTADIEATHGLALFILET